MSKGICIAVLVVLWLTVSTMDYHDAVMEAQAKAEWLGE